MQPSRDCLPRILFITSLFPSDENPGMSPFSVDIVRALAGEPSPAVIAPRRLVPFSRFMQGADSRRQEALRATYREAVRGFDIRRPGVFLPPLVGRSLHWLFYLAAIVRPVRAVVRTRGIDCIYALYAYPDGVAAVLAGLATRKPVIVHVLGCDINLFTRYFWRRKIIVWSLRRAHHVVSVSRAMKEVLVALGVPAARISVVYNGVDTTVFLPADRGACRRVLGLAEDERNVLFVGSLHEVKGVMTLLEAFRLLCVNETGARPSPRLYLIGEGPLRRSAEALVSQSGLAEKVRFLGGQPRERVARWMNACDVFCLPSVREGAPNVIMEAISSNATVVATEVGGVPELLEGYDRAFLVPPGDSGRLAAALAEALDRGSPAVAEAAPRYSWSAFRARIAEIMPTVAREERPC